MQERKQTQVLKMNLKLLASIVTTYIKYNLAARQSINSNTAGLLTSVPITQNMSSFKQKITQHARRGKKKPHSLKRQDYYMLISEMNDSNITRDMRGELGILRYKVPILHVTHTVLLEGEIISVKNVYCKL